MRLISCDGQQQSPEEGWAVVDLLIVLMLMVVVDMVVIGINNLIMMSACGVTNKVCECILVTHKKMQSSH